MEAGHFKQIMTALEEVSVDTAVASTISELNIIYSITITEYNITEYF